MQTSRRSFSRGSAAVGRALAALAGLTIGMCLLFLGPQPSAAAAGGSFRELPAALLLIEDRGCPYCARWDRDVREGYINSAEGHFAPLIRRFRGSPDVAFVHNVVYSPTFVVLAHGQEVGRIVGYAGADFFWGEVGRLLERAGFRPTAAPG